MAPRRKRSQTSDLAQDAEKRLDAATVKPAMQDTPPERPINAGPAEATEAEVMPGDDVAEASLSNDAAPGRTSDVDEPVALAASPDASSFGANSSSPRTERKDVDPVASSAAVSTAAASASNLGSQEAPRVEAVRPLAGDRPRPAAKPRRRGRALLLLIAAAAGAGLVFSGALPAVFGSKEAGEGHNPPPRLTDAGVRSEGSNNGLSAEPRPVSRNEPQGTPLEEVEALRRDLAAANTQSDERAAALTKRFEALEKQQNQKIADLTQRLDAAEKQLAQTGPSTAASAATSAESQPPAPAAVTSEDSTGSVGESDPVIASTGNTGNPLPQPRPSDLGSIAVVRPQEGRPVSTPGSAPSSPVLRSWVLRDVYDDVALIEGRYGMIEVVEGSVLPGGGVVQSIRRAGGRWIVTTNRGIIASR